MKHHWNAIEIIIYAMILSLIILIACIFIKFQLDTFNKGTLINNIDCSGLTVNEVAKKLNKSDNITLKCSKCSHTISSDKFNMSLSNVDEIKNILKEQNHGNKNSSFLLSNSFNINEISFKKYLQNIMKTCKKDNEVTSKNAYLKLSHNKLLEIVPEVYGNTIDIEKAYAIALTSLKGGHTTIDFTSSFITKPEITETNTNLILQKNSINSILKTTIIFTLPDKSTYTLNSNIMKDWISQDENCNYIINTKDGIKIFLSNMNTKVQQTNSTTNFKATGIGNIRLRVPQSRRTILDIEATTTQIEKVIGTSKTHNLTPTYKNSPYNLGNISNYVELDITRQRVWMYVNKKCILNTSCVTGSVSGGHSTPSGIFYLIYKTTNTYLKGKNNDGSNYNSFVNYWMPFYGGVGFHDASWRSNFGGKIYKTNGSHGCVNLPYSAAKTLYQNINSSIPIIVYYS